MDLNPLVSQTTPRKCQNLSKNTKTKYLKLISLYIPALVHLSHPIHPLTLRVIEEMCYLIDKIIRILKEAQQSIINLNCKIVPVFLQAKRTRKEILHPMRIYLL